MINRSALLIIAVATMLGLSSRGWAADESIKPGGVIVFGGSGRTGAEIVKLLVARGETVTVFVRATSDRKRVSGLKVFFVEGNAMSAGEVDAAFAKAKPRAAVNAIGGRGNQSGFWDTTQKNITAATKKFGGKEVIFLSSVGVGDSAVAYTPEALIRTKDVMGERFIAEEDLKASGLDYVIIRTGIIAPENAPATGKARLTEDRRAMGPVTRADLAVLTVDCLGKPACRNKTFASTDDTLKLAR